MIVFVKQALSVSLWESSCTWINVDTAFPAWNCSCGQAKKRNKSPTILLRTAEEANNQIWIEYADEKRENSIQDSIISPGKFPLLYFSDTRPEEEEKGFFFLSSTQLFSSPRATFFLASSCVEMRLLLGLMCNSTGGRGRCCAQVEMSNSAKMPKTRAFEARSTFYLCVPILVG